jgi:SAM-dependent MidA family methyltransferase
VAERLSVAMERALYGSGGFFTREAPSDHFRTSTSSSPLLAQAVARLVTEVDRAVGRPDRFTLVDVGAGRGRFLSDLLSFLGDHDRLCPVAVEKAARPAGLDDRIQWRTEVPGRFTGMLIATEWLDNVPLDVAEIDGEGIARYRLVDGTLGEPLSEQDATWIDEWWPIGEPAEAAEIGRSRDEAWTRAVSALESGLALAVDYGHTTTTRRQTLTGFRHGREVPPRFDGSTDITAHVAIDSVAAAGASCDLADGVHVRKQREALREWGVDGARPPLSLASTDPKAYVRALARASQAADLTDAAGLGDHWWVLQPVVIELPHGDFRGTGRAEHTRTP